jgi:hypothetical protein
MPRRLNVLAHCFTFVNQSKVSGSTLSNLAAAETNPTSASKTFSAAVVRLTEVS